LTPKDLLFERFDAGKAISLWSMRQMEDLTIQSLDVMTEESDVHFPLMTSSSFG